MTNIKMNDKWDVFFYLFINRLFKNTFFGSLAGITNNNK